MLIDMNILARLGARSRLTELHQEMAALRRAFPDLSDSPHKPRGRSHGSLDGAGQQKTRKRKTMSAAARKAVAARMKAYWAKRRLAASGTDGAAETKPEKREPEKKSTLSAAGRAAISAAQKKRWAARKRAGKKR
jgi:hypothetical protein